MIKNGMLKRIGEHAGNTGNWIYYFESVKGAHLKTWMFVGSIHEQSQ